MPSNLSFSTEALGVTYSQASKINEMEWQIGDIQAPLGFASSGIVHPSRKHVNDGGFR